MKNGGKRAGSGSKKGSIYAPTRAKAEAKEFLRQRVTAELGPMLDAQIANAKGLSYLVLREAKTGKFTKVSAAAAARGFKGKDIVEVWEKDPSVQSFTDLLNRVLGKPAEEVTVNGGGIPLVVQWKTNE